MAKLTTPWLDQVRRLTCKQGVTLFIFSNSQTSLLAIIASTSWVASVNGASEERYSCGVIWVKSWLKYVKLT